MSRSTDRETTAYAVGGRIAAVSTGQHMGNLLDQFVNEECSAFVRSMLSSAAGDLAQVRHHFEFNRFEVTIEHHEDVVVLHDVLDPTPAGIEHIPLTEFLAALSTSTRRGG